MNIFFQALREELIRQEKLEQLAARFNRKAGMRETWLSENQRLGMISHKMSLITIFGHKHEIKNFIKKFDNFHEKISMAFGFWFILGIKLLIVKQNYIKNDYWDQKMLLLKYSRVYIILFLLQFFDFITMVYCTYGEIQFYLEKNSSEEKWKKAKMNP